MQSLLKVNRNVRQIFSSILGNHTLEKLNIIPEGFANNIFWNIAHVVVTQQLLVYKLSGLPMNVPPSWVENFAKGTQPRTDYSQEELSILKTLLLQTLDQLENDIKQGVFKNFTGYTTSTQFEMTSVDDALHFNNFHEGIHLGIVLQIQKFIKP